MFDFKSWIEIFKEHYRRNGTIYNDAADMISLDNPTGRIEIVKSDTLLWKVLGVHHLTPYENKAPNEEFGKHNIYVEMLCKQDEREAFRAIHWTWKGRRPDESAPDIFAGQKPPNELVNIPLNLGMIVSVWPHQGETVKGFSSNHPDVDGGGNTIGHHSFFVCFQEVDPDTPPPDPDPDPDPDPPVLVGGIKVIANQAWLASLTPDPLGNITFVADIKEGGQK